MTPEDQHADKSAPDLDVVVVDLDPTWRILGLVNDWLKHAETKAAGTIATAGVSGGVLFNLVKDLNDPGAFVVITSIATTVLIVAAALSASWALRPVLRSKEDPTSHLYFHHIARAHPQKNQGATSYALALRDLLGRQDDLLKEISQQITSNADVTKRKFFWAGLGLGIVLVQIFALGLTALAVALETTL
jgi:hypothetical protein